MEVVETAIPEVKIVKPNKHGDHRGFFSETYNQKDFAAAGIDLDFVQDNHSLSADKGTVRGLHFQLHPFAQDKLVRVSRGSILDVAVDIRRGSPTFGQNVRAVVSAAEWNQVLVPIGFAHGFVTLEPNTEVLYKTTDFYSAEYDRGIIWNDTGLEIDWGIAENEAILSEKDRALPTLNDAPDLFEYSR